MAKQSIRIAFFRVVHFVAIVLSGFLLYRWFLINILTKEIHIITYILFWLISSYLFLPMVNKWITKRYLPDYFIGRSRTSDGLLADPINLAFVGAEEVLERLFLEAGWVRADDLSLKSSIKIAGASVFGKPYPKAPVSSLFLFGNKQGLAFEKEVKNNPRKRHHVRIWKTPRDWFLPGGREADWLGAATYDRKVGFSLFTGQITHKISSDIDEEREFVLESFKQSTVRVSVEVVKHFTTSYHGRNGGGDAIYTDGALPFVHLD